MSAWTLRDKMEAAEAGPLFASRSIPPQERRFRDFHARNPHVLAEVIRLARSIKDRGVTQGAIDLVFEELRRVEPVSTTGDTYRLNNVFRAYYARLAMHRAPDLAGYFEVRRQRVPFDPAGV